MIKLIWAMDKNNLIGQNDKLPWQIKEELEHFKKTTLNKTILMGDVTFLGLPTIIKDRQIYVLTKNNNLKIDQNNVTIINDFKQIIDTYFQKEENEIYICGGKTIYQLFLPYADQLIVSIINKEYFGNIYFPEVKWSDFILETEIVYQLFSIKYYKRK